jgi:hypothetical protein
MSTPKTIWHSDTEYLTLDDHTQYALLAGRSGGQTLKGGTGSGDDLTLQSTNHATKGDILFGIGAYKEATDILVLGSTTPDTQAARLSIAGTITNNTGNHAAASITATLAGSAGGGAGAMWGINPAPIFTPSASITETAAFRVDSQCNPAGGVTVTNHFGGRFVTYAGSTAGAISGMIGLQLVPVFGGIDPTNTYGLLVENNGNAGTTTSIGIYLASTAGSTNNFDLGFGRVDTTAAGAYYGRVPVLYNGLLKYIHIFDA